MKITRLRIVGQWHNFEVTTEIIVNVLLWEQEMLVGSGLWLLW